MAMASALRRLSCSSSRTRPFLWSSLCYMSSLPSEGRTRRKKSQVTVVDPENADIIELEKGRELIPSDDFLSVEMTHNIMTPYDGARLYGGIEYIDMAELVSQNRALQSFGLDPEKWGVNVQSLCGPSPNFVAYTALLKPHERILALDRPDAREEPPQAVLEKMSAVSAFFEKMPYKVARSSTGDLDYDELVKRSTLFRPKLIVAAVGSFIRRSRNEYAPLRKVCDKHKAILLVDMMDKSGLVLTGILASPFKYADIVTTTTHNFIESLLRGGPRGNIIFFRKGVKEINKQGKEVLYDFEDKINQAASPAVALKQATTPDHKAYQEQVLSNCARFAQILVSKGYELVSGGTESHFVVVDLKNKGINGTKVEAVLRLAHFPVNKWHVPGDVCDKIHGGIRMETLSLTSRGFVEEDFAKVADLFDAAVNLALKIQKIARGPTLWNFKLPTLINEDVISEISQLCHDVEEYAAQFPTIGFEKETMKNKE